MRKDDDGFMLCICELLYGSTGAQVYVLPDKFNSIFAGPKEVS
jgi:hypothetical protein